MLHLSKSIKITFIVIISSALACQEHTDEKDSSAKELQGQTSEDSTKKQLVNAPEVLAKKKKVKTHADSLSIASFPHGLIDIKTINPNIRVDLKYATADNFMKMQLYDTLRKAYLQKEVAERLGKCQEYLSSLHPDLYLLVYDAVRPVSVQQIMWDALDSIPVSERGKFVSNPAHGSVHNYGAAVDVTICNSKGIPLDMGAGYDDIRLIAYPSKEAYFLNKGELTEKQIQNRVLLRKVMSSQDFRNIPTEWWHFNAFSRSTAKARFKALI